MTASSKNSRISRSRAFQLDVICFRKPVPTFRIMLLFWLDHKDIERHDAAVLIARLVIGNRAGNRICFFPARTTPALPALPIATALHPPAPSASFLLISRVAAPKCPARVRAERSQTHFHRHGNRHREHIVDGDDARSGTLALRPQNFQCAANSFIVSCSD